MFGQGPPRASRAGRRGCDGRRVGNGTRTGARCASRRGVRAPAPADPDRRSCTRDRDRVCGLGRIRRARPPRPADRILVRRADRGRARRDDRRGRPQRAAPKRALGPHRDRVLLLPRRRDRPPVARDAGEPVRVALAGARLSHHPRLSLRGCGTARPGAGPPRRPAPGDRPDPRRLRRSARRDDVRLAVLGEPGPVQPALAAAGASDVVGLSPALGLPRRDHRQRRVLDRSTPGHVDPDVAQRAGVLPHR